MSKKLPKKNILIILIIIFILYLISRQFNSKYTLEYVEEEMNQVLNVRDLRDKFGEPAFIRRNIDGLYTEYTYYEADDKKIKNGFVGFEVRLSTNGVLISWNPVYMSDLDEFIKE